MPSLAVTPTWARLPDSLNPSLVARRTRAGGRAGYRHDDSTDSGDSNGFRLRIYKTWMDLGRANRQVTRRLRVAYFRTEVWSRSQEPSQSLFSTAPGTRERPEDRSREG